MKIPLRRVITGTLIAIVATVTCEYAYRFIRVRRFALQPSMWVADPQLVYRLNPANPNTPGSFRGQAPLPIKSGLRILCVGGSTTYGHDLPLQESWPALLNLDLRARGSEAEVINAGTPGYGSRQQLLRYRSELARLNADLVLIHEGLNRTGALVDSEGWVPFGITRSNHDLVTQLALALASHSLIVRQLLTARQVRSQMAAPPQAAIDPHQDEFVADITALVNEIAQRRQRPVLIVYPTLLHAGMSADDVRLYAARLWEHRRYHPDMLVEIERKHDALRAVARATQCALIDVQASFADAHGSDRLPYFLDDMHLSAAGNRRLAHVLGAQVAKLLERP